MLNVSTHNFKITPSFPSALAGYVRSQKSNGVHDDLYAKMLLLKDDNFCSIFIQFDLCMVEEKLSDFIKKSILALYPELNINDINLFAIHTHSGPSEFVFDPSKPQLFNKDITVFEEDINTYKEEIISEILKGIKELFQNLKPVHVKYTNGTIDGLYSNRNYKDKVTDKEYTLFKFYDNEDKIQAEVLNISCHPTILGPNNLLISADLFGELGSKIKQEHKVVPMFMNGACANISTRMCRKGTDFNEVKRVANELFDQISSNADEKELALSYKKSFSISEKVDFIPDIDNLMSRRKYIEEKIKRRGRPDPTRDKVLISEIEAINSKINGGEVHFTVNMKVEIYGELCIVYFPGELDSNLGLKIKNTSPYKNTIIACYANGYNGYFVAKDEYGKTFETYVSNAPCGKAEEIVDNIIDTILKSKDKL